MEYLREKFLLISSILPLTLFISVVAIFPPVRSYEVSVYTGYPWFTWVFLGLCLASSAYLVIESARSGSSAWVGGVATAVVAYGFFFAIPLLRGYAVYGPSLADAFIHLGALKDILKNGQLSDYLFYPASHIEMTGLVLTTGLSRRVIASLVPYLFFIVLMTSVFIFARYAFGSTLAKYCVAAAIPIVFLKYQMTLMPWLNGLAMTLFIFGIALKAGHSFDNRYRSLLLLFTFSLVFYHPISAVLTAAGLGAWLVISGHFDDDPMATESVVILTPILVYIWYLSFQPIQLALVRATQSLLGPSEGTTEYTQAAATSGYTIEQLVTRWIIGRWGVAIIFASVGAVACTLILYRVYQGRQQSKLLFLPVEYGYGIVVGLLLVVTGVFASNPIRVMQFPILISIPLFGYLLYHADRSNWTVQKYSLSKYATPALAGLLVISAPLGAMTAYNTDRHVTHTTVEGVSWQIEHQDSSLLTRSNNIDDKLLHHIYGNERARSLSRPDKTFSTRSDRKSVPESIGYQTHQHVSQLFPDSGGYLVIRDDDIIRYNALPPSRRAAISGYTAQNLSRLHTDPSADQVYSSGRYYTYWISSGSLAP